MDESKPGPAALTVSPLAGGPDTTFQLLERARAGDDSALEALFARYLQPLRRWASGRLPRSVRDGVDTQDLVQETLLQVFKKIEGFESRGEGALQAYLRQALMNRIRNELRRHDRRGQGVPLDSQVPDDDASPLEQTIGAEALQRYEEALGRLRPEEREAIIGRVELGYTYEQLAATLGKSSSEAARKAAERALVRLAAEMKRGEGHA